MATSSTTNGEPQAEGTIAQGLINMHRYKMTPPTFTGEYGTFEEWKYKFQAYMGLMDNALPQLLENTENSTTIIKDADLVAAASSTEEANKWIQLSTDLRYILFFFVFCTQHMLRSSSNNMQTTPDKQWL